MRQLQEEQAKTQYGQVGDSIEQMGRYGVGRGRLTPPIPSQVVAYWSEQTGGRARSGGEEERLGLCKLPANACTLGIGARGPGWCCPRCWVGLFAHLHGCGEK